MRKLIIRDKGYKINIHGIPSIRTPVKIDITKFDVNRIKIEMIQHGIENYSIIEDGKEIKMKKPKKSKKKNIFLDGIDFIRNFNKRMDKMESILEKIIDKPVTVIERNIEIGTEQIIKNVRKKKEQPVDKFIPTIDISGMSMKESTLSIRKEKLEENNSETADALSEMLKKK